jgi:hypothetical protein
LADLFALTTVVAIAAGVARVVSFPDYDALRVVLDGLVLAAGVVICLLLISVLSAYRESSRSAAGAVSGSAGPDARGRESFAGERLSVWLADGPQKTPDPVWPRLLFLAIFACGAVFVLLSRVPSPIVAILGFETAFSLAAAWVLHCCGYRPIWRRQLRAVPATCLPTLEN